MNLRNGLLAGAFALLAVVAAVGWSKAERSSSAAVNPPAFAQTAANGQTTAYGQAVNPATGQAANSPAYGQSADYNSSANSGSAAYTGSANDTYAANASYSSYGNPQGPCVDTGNGATYGTSEYYPDGRYVQAIHRPVVVRRYADTRPVYTTTTEVREERVHHHRSGKKSVAIVAGSAGVGAAIGAIAGGGKGAGIGALAGGAGGFIYDRLTHNR